jgi:hypothetical protein
MADCDLCGVAIPTVCPVKVFEPRFEHSYPEGKWQGLCERCLDSAKKVYDAHAMEKEEQVCMKPGDSFGTCDLCGNATQLYEVDVEVPSFTKGYEKETRRLCRKCLEGVNEAYDRKGECFGEHH